MRDYLRLQNKYYLSPQQKRINEKLEEVINEAMEEEMSTIGHDEKISKDEIYWGILFMMERDDYKILETKQL